MMSLAGFRGGIRPVDLEKAVPDERGVTHIAG